MSQAIAIAHSNIALAKYWGKANVEQNLTAVPSLSMTLDALSTRTEVYFDPALSEDELQLDGKQQSGRTKQRVSQLLDRIRAKADTVCRARVISSNNFPTAAGLASSASGFAALAMAASSAAGLRLSSAEISSLSRASSASAARSVFGAYVALNARALSAEPVLNPDEFPLAMLVAVTAKGPKKVGSTEGMTRTAQTSPYYQAWLDRAPAVYDRIRVALLEKQFEALGEAVEESAMMMHASMLAAKPAIRYFRDVTIAAMQRVEDLRDQGIPAYYTMDAGPHVKVLTLPEHAEVVERELRSVAQIQDVISCRPGPAAYLIGDAKVSEAK